MRATLLLCLVAGVSYGQAMVPRPPPPPPPIATPAMPLPGVQGPRIGPVAPGPGTAPTLPLSPDKRVLPAEARPGIWASDGADKTPDVASRLEEAPATPSGIAQKAWKQCWSTSQSCILADPRGVRATLAQFQCLRWEFSGVCGGIMVDKGALKYPGFRAKYGAGPYNLDDFHAATRPANYAPCKEAWPSKGYDDLYRWLYAKCSPEWFKAAQ